MSTLHISHTRASHARATAYDVAVIGGGLAGLSASVTLAKAGLRVALIEQRSELGGRCYSYTDQVTGDVVENGQHILLGAYHSTLRYLDMIGTRHLLRIKTHMDFPFHHPVKHFAAFSVGNLPRPFHITAGLLRFSLLSFRERQSLLAVGRALWGWGRKMESELSRLTVLEWLRGLRQSDESLRCLWNPIAVSVMNETPDRASALLFARSLRQAFLGRKRESTVLIPTVGQTELYVGSAEKLLLEGGARILRKEEVAAIETEGAVVTGVRLRSGREIPARAVISAVPHYAVGRMLHPALRKAEPFSHLEEFSSTPIVSIHLWFDEDFMETDYLGLIARRVQWVFNRRRILVARGKPAGYLSAVISGAYDFVDLSQSELIELALEDIRGTFPVSRRSRLVHSVVIKEKRATFSPRNEVERFRPSAVTPIGNFFLAGDWTDTGLPATIEGAVASGFRAAQLAAGVSSGTARGLSAV